MLFFRSGKFLTITVGYRCAVRSAKRWLILTFLSVLIGVGVFTPAQAHVKFGWDCLKSETKDDCLKRGGLTGIYIFDEIVSDDAEKFEWIDKTLQTEKTLPKIYINSQGGSASAAVTIARMLSKRKAAIEEKNPYSEYPPARCYSACVFIAAGAVDRQFDQIGVHPPHRLISVGECKTNWEDMPDAELAQFLKIFSGFGLPQNFIEAVSNTPSKEITDFRYDPNIPDENQPIVEFGFRMHKSDSKPNFAAGENEKANQLAAISLLTEIAEDGDAAAAYELGKIFSGGTHFVGVNTKDAISWYEKAGSLGYGRAYQALGLYYHSGRGGKRDFERAISYYTKAAELGYAGSQNNLGWMYYKAEGVKRDVGKAIFWISRSLEQGEPFAYGSIGEILFHGFGIDKDDIQAYKWFLLADERMPKGSSHDANHKLLEEITKRMKQVDINEATKMARAWSPLKQTKFRMANRCER